jgi:hypothetical protein
VRIRTAVIAALLGTIALLIWRAELFTVARPGEAPRALALLPPERRAAVALDVALPVVPVGMQRLRSAENVLLIHYWAPWEQHARVQAAHLDSLRRHPDLERVRAVLVCFDPFPSVARYVARQRLRIPVLLDGHRELRAALPCPSIPYTYVIDAAGRIAVAQAGEVNWWDPDTRIALIRILREGDRAPTALRASRVQSRAYDSR